ncbi:MAG TPA: CHAT domain-containing protein [Gammaproteobacteria bacterium]
METAARDGCEEPQPAAAVTVDELVQTADCEQAAGRASAARAALDRALRLAEAQAPDAADRLAAIHGRLGRVHASLGEQDAAIEHLEAGIAAAAAVGRPAEAAAWLNDLGRAYMAIDEPLRGLAAFADSRRLATTPALRLTAALNLARARSEIAPEPDLFEALAAIDTEAARLDDASTQAAILAGLAELYRTLATRAAEPDRALHASRKAAERALAAAAASGDWALAADGYGQLGAAHAALGAIEPALAATRQAVLIAQESAINDRLYRWEWQTARLLRRMGKEPEALVAYRGAIDTLGKTQAWIVPSRRAFRRDVLPLYEEYADLMLAGARGRPPAEAGDRLREVQQTLEQLRIAEVRNYFENDCAVPEVLDPAPQRPEGTLVIYPMLFADRMELLVNTASRLSQFTVDVGLAELAREARLLREAIEDPTATDDYLPHAQRLYEWLLRPLEPLLADAAPDTLVIVPDGPLRTIPLAVLHDGERFLVQRYALATTPGLSLIGAVGAEPVTRALVSGLTAPVQGFPPLPYVAEELRSIEAAVPSRVYSDEAFVTSTLEREILEGGYSIVHLATHARFESDYRRSFLLAYDDVITMDDLENAMGSQRYTDRPVDLLVLSACQTAVGDERAALGLAGVAVKAGARSALASLWFVNDESTALLIAEFYRQLATPGNDKAEALRGAQLRLMNDERYRHPAYWAPFLLIGDWR